MSDTRELDDMRTDCRRLAQQIVGSLNAPDIVALQEIQDNSGTTDDGVVAAAETFAALIAAIEAAGLHAARCALTEANLEDVFVASTRRRTTQ